MVTDTDVQILRLAADRYRFEAHRLEDARLLFGLGPAQFWQAVNRLLGDEEALRAHPELVMPLRRQRAQQGRLKRTGNTARRSA